MEPIIGEAVGNGAIIKDSDTENFMIDVVEASSEVPVIVDFWAPWCGPCKELGPALERAVNGAGGTVRLIKINVDENPDLAQQMRIQSIPAVYAFKDGRPVDGFVGAVPESQIKSFVDKLAEMGGGAQPSPIAEALEQAKTALEAGDTGTAGALFGQILNHESSNIQAAAGLARCRLASGELTQARELLNNLSSDAESDPHVAAARSALALAEKASEAGDVSELGARLAADENDHQARHDLAMALYAENQTEAAIEELLEIVRRKRDWNDDAARKQLLEFFEALGPTHELTIAGRRRLSSILFS